MVPDGWACIIFGILQAASAFHLQCRMSADTLRHSVRCLCGSQKNRSPLSDLRWKLGNRLAYPSCEVHKHPSCGTAICSSECNSNAPTAVLPRTGGCCQRASQNEVSERPPVPGESHLDGVDVPSTVPCSSEAAQIFS